MSLTHLDLSLHLRNQELCYQAHRDINKKAILVECYS